MNVSSHVKYVNFYSNMEQVFGLIEGCQNMSLSKLMLRKFHQTRIQIWAKKHK